MVSTARQTYPHTMIHSRFAYFSVQFPLPPSLPWILKDSFLLEVLKSALHLLCRSLRNSRNHIVVSWAGRLSNYPLELHGLQSVIITFRHYIDRGIKSKHVTYWSLKLSCLFRNPAHRRAVYSNMRLWGFDVHFHRTGWIIEWLEIEALELDKARIT